MAPWGPLNSCLLSLPSCAVAFFAPPPPSGFFIYGYDPHPVCSLFSLVAVDVWSATCSPDAIDMPCPCNLIVLFRDVVKMLSDSIANWLSCPAANANMLCPCNLIIQVTRSGLPFVIPLVMYILTAETSSVARFLGYPDVNALQASDMGQNLFV